MLRMGRNQKGDQISDTQPAEQHTSQSPTAHHHNSGATNPVTTSSSGGESGNSSSSGYQPSSTHTAAAAASSSAPSSTSRAVTESESLARDIKEGTLSGFVGNGTVLTGEASFKGMLRVDGHLSGRVSSHDGTLIVSNNGQVDANIEVAVAQIYGTVNGDIIASKRIEMGRAARVTGNIQTPALVIENGAVFEGGCRMVQLKEAQEQRRPEETARASLLGGGPAMKSTVENADVPAASDIAS